MARPIEHIVTEKTKNTVESLTSFGNTQEEIARYLNISVDTLYKNYKFELENGVLQANAQVAAKLFRKATRDNDLSAQIFWMKTRGKWRTTDKNEAIAMDSLVQKLIDKL